MSYYYSSYYPYYSSSYRPYYSSLYRGGYYGGYYDRPSTTTTTTYGPYSSSTTTTHYDRGYGYGYPYYRSYYSYPYRNYYDRDHTVTYHYDDPLPVRDVVVEEEEYLTPSRKRTVTRDYGSGYTRVTYSSP
uniref:Uncharacterized protein n=1 Tax=Euplotes crassus TaxID=5936 RepID=A0A7S3KH54_EUPCR|mmetsp:Transcript_24218/g.24153  ORF Transcript_24218/g.24153 Transcript_24218/m.24153 type:complete len:131 (+) Transcript_24218:10-402(+)